MIKKIFRKNKYSSMSVSEINKTKDTKEMIKVPDGMWVKCKKCGRMLYKDDLIKQQMICSSCNHHFRMTAQERIKSIIDEGSFKEFDKELTSGNPLEIKGYEDKLKKAKEKSGLNEGVVTGYGKINNLDVVISVMDANFMMGSMGSVVGEKLTRAIEKATEKRCPIIIFCASGGARMQEGIFSLMQMVKTSAALARHSEAGLLYISVLTDPTTGGVSASFAMQGDIILAEPGALIGFAGARVIEQTIKQKLPEGFQSAEFLLEHGFVDKIVSRKDMKNVLHLLVSMHKEVESFELG
ncbi:acetyl-CoA carboxylase, carboxyltransferase subunit beta [Abyssisolibacter fermentans]|uniref:acetyl-CoA carboxylase, carboxyltransferase subunit beta n=1 Tax=Abyssisolibacter fermentans TaxID=1766203 RepID=UPI0008369389|nr:acetyl-CoA carboxylase, carboxyltransferase subunit beta [Abyssisolibacter fermentans]